MLTVQNTKHFRLEKQTIVTIGTFDGVHLGHQKILSRLQQLKQRHGLSTVVLTFEPHPRKVLFPDQKDLKLLTLVDEKLDMLENYGVDVTVVYPFDKNFSNFEAQDYIEKVLIKSLKVKYLVIGYDHHFGKDRKGNIRVLQDLKDKYGYEVEEISAMDIDHNTISSSKIRHALETGNVDLANEFLGHYYFLYADVVPGKKLGRTIGYPTANLNVESEDKLIPRIGIYFVEAVFDGKNHYGMMSIGTNPTTDTDQKLKVEVHVLDFEGDLYKKHIRVNFIKYLRDEKKFNGLEELKAALDADHKQCRELIEDIKNKICVVVKK